MSAITAVAQQVLQRALQLTDDGRADIVDALLISLHDTEMA